MSRISADEELVARLAGLSGLDPPSVQEQLVPYLRSLPRSEASSHLSSMLGPDAPLELLTGLLFPPAPAAQKAPSGAFPALARSGPSAEALLSDGYARHQSDLSRSLSAQNAQTHRKKGKPPAVGLAHTKPGHLPAPREARTLAHPLPAHEHAAYSKDRGLDDIGAQYGVSPARTGKKPKHKNASARGTPSLTPASQTPDASRPGSPAQGDSVHHIPPHRLGTPDPDPEFQTASSGDTRTVDASNAAKDSDKNDIMFPLPTAISRPKKPTEEFLSLEGSLAEVRAPHPPPSFGSQGRVERTICMCNGHVHAPCPWIPLCSSCHLVLCTALVPAPYAPYAQCPSCGAPPLQPDSEDRDGGHAEVHHRKELYIKIMMRYESLAQELVETEEREERAKEVQRQLLAERQRADAARIAEQRGQAISRAELDRLFPTLLPSTSLGTTTSKTVTPSEAVEHKTHRVLRLNTTTHKISSQRKAPRARSTPAVQTSASTPPQSLFSQALLQTNEQDASHPLLSGHASEEEFTEADRRLVGLRVLISDPYDQGASNLTHLAGTTVPPRTAQKAERPFAPPIRPPLRLRKKAQDAEGEDDETEEEEEPEQNDDVLYLPSRGERRPTWVAPPWSAWVQAGVPPDPDLDPELGEENKDGTGSHLVQRPILGQVMPQQRTGSNVDGSGKSGSNSTKDIAPPLVKPRFAASTSSEEPTSFSSVQPGVRDPKSQNGSEGQSQGETKPNGKARGKESGPGRAPGPGQGKARATEGTKTRDQESDTSTTGAKGKGKAKGKIVQKR